MQKDKSFCLVILGLCVLSGFLMATSCLAEEESITITTYYPSPYGSYNQLEVHRSVTYKPLPDSDVVNDRLSDPQIGELVYTDADKFYHYNGSWVAQAGGGGGGYFLQCGSTCPDGTQRVGAARGGTAINGAIAETGYLGFLIDFDESTGTCTCICQCSDYISVGVGYSCTEPYTCASKRANGCITLATNPDCEAYCKQKVGSPSTAKLSNISVCK